jgi:hypothetical protein
MDFNSSYSDLEAIAKSMAPTSRETVEISEKCLTRVSKHFSIPEVILETFLKTEGGYPGHIRENSNNTVDVGPMQINSIHWEEIYYKFNISPIDIRFNGCINLMVGTRIIRSRLDEEGREDIGNWKQLITVLAKYHSKTEVHNKAYQVNWIKNLENILVGEK